MSKPSSTYLSHSRRAICTALAITPLSALAQLQVQITGVGSQQFPISVANFARNGQAPAEIDSIIRADLTRSGLFRVVDAGTQPIAENSSINFGEWKGRGADALVVGSIARLADGRFDVRYRLHDTVKQTQLDGLSYVSTAADLRLTAHRIADRIYEKITGERGVFATRIAYVVQTSPKSWELHIADSDGFNSQAALRSREPIISPAWSPDGTRLAYVSFESGKPVVYVHSVATGERRAVANFRGSNSAPAWSPDGRSLAVTLTREGNSQVFLMNADGSNLKALTADNTIAFYSPVWSPDGKKIVYYTEKGDNKDQIWVMNADGTNQTLLTNNIAHNFYPSWSADGKQIIFSSNRDGQQAIYTMNADGSNIKRLSGVDSSYVRYSPNGKKIAFVSGKFPNMNIFVANADGTNQVKITNK